MKNIGDTRTHENHYYESLDFSEVRKKSNPPWRRSVRALSEKAFYSILTSSETDQTFMQMGSQIEVLSEALDTLKKLNSLYAGLKPEIRSNIIENHLDRGYSVSRALKQILGCQCQICGWKGFKTRDGTEFIEAHHLNQISERCLDSLCTDNIILVCPNCHREIHYGLNVEINDDGNTNKIRMFNKTIHIPKNTIPFLENKNALMGSKGKFS